jgi:hypothetical protein
MLATGNHAGDVHIAKQRPNIVADGARAPKSYGTAGHPLGREYGNIKNLRLYRDGVVEPSTSFSGLPRRTMSADLGRVVPTRLFFFVGRVRHAHSQNKA